MTGVKNLCVRHTAREAYQTKLPEHSRSGKPPHLELQTQQGQPCLCQEEFPFTSYFGMTEYFEDPPAFPVDLRGTSYVRFLS